MSMKRILTNYELSMVYPGIVDMWRWRQTAFPSRFSYVFSHRISCDYLVLWKKLLGGKPETLALYHKSETRKLVSVSIGNSFPFPYLWRQGRLGLGTISLTHPCRSAMLGTSGSDHMLLRCHLLEFCCH